MNNILKGIKDEINKTFEERKKQDAMGIPNHTKTRILDLIYRIKVSINIPTVSSYFIHIVEMLNDFNAKLKTQDELRIINSLKEIEKSLLEFIVTDLKIPSFFSNQIRDKTFRNDENSGINSYLPKFIFHCFEHDMKISNQGLNPIITFIDFEEHFKKFSKNLGLGFNTFTKFVAKKILCENVTADEYSLSFNFLRIEGFLQLFFGSKENYKFYGKINQVVESFHLRSYDRAIYPINVSLTKARVQYKGKQRVLPLHQITIHPFGVNVGKLNPELDEDQPETNLDTFRNDGIVVFGKHPACDIRLPSDDPEAENVAFLIINQNDDYHMIDLSRKMPAYLKIWPKRNGDIIIENTPLIQNQIFSLAKTMNFLVSDIKYIDTGDIANDDVHTFNYENQPSIMNSELKLKFFDHPYKDREFTFSTKKHKQVELKTEHAIGSGGGGVPPDIYIPKDKGISGLHCKVFYDPMTKVWSILDTDSRNGTFRLLKNENQFTSKTRSEFFKLFGDGFDDANSSLLLVVCNYTFYIFKPFAD